MYRYSILFIHFDTCVSDSKDSYLSLILTNSQAWSLRFLLLYFPNQGVQLHVFWTLSLYLPYLLTPFSLFLSFSLPAIFWIISAIQYYNKSSPLQLFLINYWVLINIFLMSWSSIFIFFIIFLFYFYVFSNFNNTDSPVQ